MPDKIKAEKTKAVSAQDAPGISQPLKAPDLLRAEQTRFEIAPTKDQLAEIATHLGAKAVRKCHFEGTIKATPDGSLLLTGELGATVELMCVVSLEAFNQRIDTSVRRLYQPGEAQDALQSEIALAEDFDEDIEPLGPEVDPASVLLEELALQIPPFPRASEARLEQTQFAAPGITPLDDDAAKPFAALAALKAKTVD